MAGIREAILSGEFVPNQRLIEADLSERFAAGRAAVRAALLELANEGLIERVQNRGARDPRGARSPRPSRSPRSAW